SSPNNAPLNLNSDKRERTKGRHQKILRPRPHAIVLARVVAKRCSPSSLDRILSWFSQYERLRLNTFFANKTGDWQVFSGLDFSVEPTCNGISIATLLSLAYALL